ncbi:uncharacterized protein [Procambarus clarkii]|uniref:uncharacterized protein isoform X1 n=2 Tax=Procambarus clarkii TaxID=6728 RepID=UPI003744AD6E
MAEEALQGRKSHTTMTDDKEEAESMSCVVCEETFDTEGHRPVALPGCGHTFCRPCLVNLQKHSTVLLCPTCRRPHEGVDASGLPTNFLVMNLLSGVSESDDAMLHVKNSDGNEKKVDENQSSTEEAGHDTEEDEDNIVRKDYTGKHRGQNGKQRNEPQDCPSAVCNSSRGAEELQEYIWYKDWKIRLLFGVFILVTAAIGVGVALGCNTYVLNQMGFTSTGIVRKSYASKLMSSTSRSNNGTIPPESWVAWLQNAGHKGFDSKTQAGHALLGALAGVLVGTLTFGVMVAVCLGVRRCRSTRTEQHLLVDDVPLMTNSEVISRKRKN